MGWSAGSTGGSGVCRCPYPTTHGDNMEPILADSSGIYEQLDGYRNLILSHHKWLCGDEIGPSAATDSWQIYAANLAGILRNYARLLEALGKGTIGFRGPVVFPSWEPEPKEPEGDKGYDDVSMFMAAVRHDIRLNKMERKKAEGGAE